MFKEELQDAFEIADFISEISMEHVDNDLIIEYFFNCKGTLKKMCIEKITEGVPDVNITDRNKERKYALLSIDTMPPLIVENGVVIDGNHRLRVAKKKKQKEIYIYDIIEIDHDTIRSSY